MAKTTEPKQILEREYIIPLRKEWLKVPEYKRANKAVKAIKEFLVRHMKIYDRDLRKVKLDVLLNNEIRFRGIRKPPARIRVKATKFDNNIVRVGLVEIPVSVKFKKAREEKLKKEEEIKEKKTEEEKPGEIKPVEIKEEEVEEEKKVDELTGEEIKKELKEVKEKEETSKEAEMKLAKQKAKEQKHLTKIKEEKIFRRALRK